MFISICFSSSHVLSLPADPLSEILLYPLGVEGADYASKIGILLTNLKNGKICQILRCSVFFRAIF